MYVKYFKDNHIKFIPRSQTRKLLEKNFKW